MTLTFYPLGQAQTVPEKPGLGDRKWDTQDSGENKLKRQILTSATVEGKYQQVANWVGPQGEENMSLTA